MCILYITKAIKRMSINAIRDFIFKDYCKGTGFSKESSYYSVKLRALDLLLFSQKLIKELLTQVKRFKFVKVLVLVFKR